MPGSVEAAATVNSVVGRWSLALEGQRPPGERSRLVVLASLQQLGLRSWLSRPAEERCEVKAVAGDDGVPRASGVSEFHFLLPRRRYRFELRLEGSAQAVACCELRTLELGRGLPAQLADVMAEEAWRLYVGSEHELGEWLARAPEEMVWAFRPGFPLLRSLWLNACFTLPSPDSPITQCPNPSARYCLDLTRPSAWLRGKKVRRHKADFSLTVNADYQGTFRRCGQLHKDRGQGTWITPELVEALDRCRLECGELKVYSVELWEKSTGELAAAIMALSVGDIFHDYTMATMKRDARSPGAVLSKVLGHLLAECGYSLWYWGFKNPYMAEYDEGYGGLLMDSQKDFWPRWKAARQLATPCDLAGRVQPGMAGALDLATL